MDSCRMSHGHSNGYSNNRMYQDNYEEHCEPRKDVSVNKLCAQCGKICWLKAKKLWSDEVQANKGCFQNLQSHDLLSNAFSTNRLCAQDANIKNLCVDNLQVKNPVLLGSTYTKYRASAVFTNDSVYTLDADLSFDTIIDDPNGNLALGPLKYTAPLAGTYLVTLHLNTRSLATNDPIVGVPVAQSQIKVNGVMARDVYGAYLAFSSEQSSALTTMFNLNAGDVVTAAYGIIIGSATGTTKVVGTVVVEGPPSPTNNSAFSIILLSERTPGTGPTPFPCITCAPVEIPCEPVEVMDCPPRVY